MPQYFVERSYRQDDCFHRARIKANSDAEARSEAPTVAAHTNATSYKLISVEQNGENRRIVYDSAINGPGR
jgi:hypothetical protein